MTWVVGGVVKKRKKKILLKKYKLICTEKKKGNFLCLFFLWIFTNNMVKRSVQSFVCLTCINILFFYFYLLSQYSQKYILEMTYLKKKKTNIFGSSVLE